MGSRSHLGARSLADAARAGQQSMRAAQAIAGLRATILAAAEARGAASGDHTRLREEACDDLPAQQSRRLAIVTVGNADGSMDRQDARRFRVLSFAAGGPRPAAAGETPGTVRRPRRADSGFASLARAVILRPPSRVTSTRRPRHPPAATR